MAISNIYLIINESTRVRIDYGVGYRTIVAQSGVTMVLSFCGGDKSSQNRDIIALRAIQNSKFKIQKQAMTRFQALLMS